MARLAISDISTLNGFVLVDNLDNFGTVGVAISGTWVGTITFQASLDGTTFQDILATRLDYGVPENTTTVNGSFIINVSGFVAIRTIMTSYTSGTASVFVQAAAPVAAGNVLATIAGATDGTRIGNASDRLKTEAALIGADGLYRAHVDSVGRLSTNANVTFPETVYSKTALRNGSSKSMNVNGSSSNVSFKFTPTVDVYYLEQLSIVIEDQGDFLPSNFGALAALTNGVVINVKSKGQIFTLSTLKDNSDIYGTFTEAPASQSISVLLQSNRNTYWAGWRLQSRIALDPSLGDYVEFLIRDNLSGLNTFNAYVSAWRILG